MNSPTAFEELLCDIDRSDRITENAPTAETMDDAERRATQVFEMLLTVLSSPQRSARAT